MITEYNKPAQRNSYQKEKELSHTTSSQVVYEEAHIMAGWKLKNIFHDGTKFYLEL